MDERKAEVSQALSPLRSVLNRFKFKDKIQVATARPSRHPDGRPVTPPKLPELLVETQENKVGTLLEEYRSRPSATGSIEVAHVDGKLILRTNGLLLQSHKIVPEGQGWKVIFELDSKSLANTPTLSPWVSPHDTPPGGRRILKPLIPVIPVIKPESPINRTRDPLRG